MLCSVILICTIEEEEEEECSHREVLHHQE